MSRNCDSYREQALIEGMGSHATTRWCLHSKNCNFCRSEISMLETLCREAGEQRQHISHKDYVRLMETVRQLYQPKKQPRWGMVVWNLSWKTASLAALLMLVFKIAMPFGPIVKVRTHSMPEQPVRSEIFADTFTTGADQGRQIAAPMPMQDNALSKAELTELFNSLPGTPFEQNLQSLRNSVAGQIDALSILLDRELNGDL